MKDAADNKTLELPALSETVTKKRGRPSTGKAQTDAERKAVQRLRDREQIFKLDVPEWTHKNCLVILNDRSFTIGMKRMAAKRLVEILCDNHDKGE
jgi:hypothetical protein